MAKKRKTKKRAAKKRKPSISSAMRAELIKAHIRMPHGYEIVPTKKRKPAKKKAAKKRTAKKRKR